MRTRIACATFSLKAEYASGATATHPTDRLMGALDDSDPASRSTSSDRDSRGIGVSGPGGSPSEATSGTAAVGRVEGEHTSPSSSPARPEIGRFADYRDYLRHMTAYLRQTRPGFSFRSFARRAGFASPNYLKLVTDGQRNLAPESVDRFARGLGLDKREHDVFRMLVLMANARSDEERNAIYARLRSCVLGDEVARLRDDQFAVYDMWWALVVREMVALPDFVLDAAWVARRLRPRVRVAQAQKAIDLLLRLGMVIVEDGRPRLAEATISTGPEVTSLGVRNYHRAHLDLAARSLDEVEKSGRNVTSLTLRLSKAQYAEAVEEIAQLRRRLLEIADGEGDGSVDDPGEVHSAVFALFPVTDAARDRQQPHAPDEPDEADGS
jgi:uncharacterized protein (TIGR02147 family)